MHDDRRRAAQFCENARYFLALGTERALQSALYFFDQALAVDARCAAAFAGKARCYAEIGDGGAIAPPIPQLRALDFSARALAIEPLAEAAAIHAKALVELSYDWDAADAHLLRAAEHGETRAARALLAALRGRCEEALMHTSAVLPRAIALLYARRIPEALALLDLAGDLGTRLWHVPTLRGLAHYLEGRIDLAIVAWERSRREHEAAAWYLLHAYAACGRGEDYHALRSELDDRPATGQRSPFWEALAAAGAGEAEAAIAALERGLAGRDPWMTRTLVEPMLDPLRGEPAFERIAACVRDGTELPARPGT